MATRHYCDRCDTEIGFPKTIMEVPAGFQNKEKRYELCVHCVDMVHGVLKPILAVHPTPEPQVIPDPEHVPTAPTDEHQTMHFGSSPEDVTDDLTF